MGDKERVAILGGGMAGMSAAWRLSEPGWQDRYEDIVVYQRGHRLGGKGASSRGTHGRIEEHGLHIWLGYYENAFRLLREFYDELDRTSSDPTALIKTWSDALKPSVDVGLQDMHDGQWSHWLGDFSPNDLVPGEPGPVAREMTVQEFVRRAYRLLVNFHQSIGNEAAASQIHLSASPTAPPPQALLEGLSAIALGALLEGIRAASSVLTWAKGPTALAQLDDALTLVRNGLSAMMQDQEQPRRMWHLISVVVATIRGIVADGLLTDPRGFSAINDEDYREWIQRHGCAPEAAASTLIRGLYDLVFAHAAGDPDRPGFGAGLGVFLSAKTFFDYKGAIFWKMQAGMGDVVFAPMYQCLVKRGVRFEFFHRLDELKVSNDDSRIERIVFGRQAHLRDRQGTYEALVRCNDLPSFPQAPLEEQLEGANGIADQALESIWCEWPDVDRVELARGEDFDKVIFAIPPGMAKFVCQDLITRRKQWRDMVNNLGTVATAAFQIWLRPDEPSLGWAIPGVTVSGYVKPYDTWASMPQLVPVENWPADDQPGTIAYFCSVIPTPPDVDPTDFDYPRKRNKEARDAAVAYLENHIAHMFPRAMMDGQFRWDLLCGGNGATDELAFDSQFWTANVDPSDLYVQSLPGTDKYRLRADESGYENLFLAGDWTNSGLNAGCIESAVLSGLQAANAVLGNPLDDRVAGFYMDDWTRSRSG